MSNLFWLAGKVALITGSSRGLGLGMATGMAEAGAYITGQELYVDGGVANSI